MSFRYSWEKDEKFTCPSCKEPGRFRRLKHVPTDTLLPEEYGTCDRNNSCQHHKTEADWIRENPEEHKRLVSLEKKGRPGLAKSKRKKSPRRTARQRPAYLDSGLLNSDYETSNLYQYLKEHIREDALQAACDRYRIGASDRWPGSILFPYLDKNGLRQRKHQLHDPENGKRRKDGNYTVCDPRKTDFGELNLVQCFFGEHLLYEDPEAPVGIVESEKTALIAAALFPDWIWLATGGKNGVKLGKQGLLLTGRHVVLFPDADAEDKWEDEAEQMRGPATVNLSRTVDDFGPALADGDPADYILMTIRKTFEIPQPRRSALSDLAEEAKVEKDAPADLSRTLRDALLDRDGIRQVLRSFKPVEGQEDVLIYDLEVLENYFLAIFLEPSTGRWHRFTVHDWEAARDLVRGKILVGYNSVAYDDIILSDWIGRRGYATCAGLRELSNTIIRYNYKGETEKDRVKNLFRSLDMKMTLMGSPSLKDAQARMQLPYVVEPPIDLSKPLPEGAQDDLRLYCAYDVYSCAEIFRRRGVQRRTMCEKLEAEFGVEVLHLTNPQIGRVVMTKVSGVDKVEEDYFEPFTRKAADLLVRDFEFRDPHLRALKEEFCSRDVVLEMKDGNKGSDVKAEFAHLPENRRKKILFNLQGGEGKLTFGGFRLGRKGALVHASKDRLLWEMDVTSFYPSLIVAEDLFENPRIKESFANILKMRVEAKRAGDKVWSGALKIVLNSIFGQASKPYAPWYSRDLKLKICFNGQFLMMSLLDALLQIPGLEIYYVNTDGLSLSIPAHAQAALTEQVRQWESTYGLTLESDPLDAIWVKDTNNRVYAKDGQLHSSGADVSVSTDLDHGPTTAPVITRSVAEHYLLGTEVAEAITSCSNPMDFLFRKGGSTPITLEKDGVDYQLGKQVRYLLGPNGATLKTPSNRSKNGYNVTKITAGKVHLQEGVPSLDQIDMPSYIEYARDLATKLDPRKARRKRKENQAQRELKF